MTFACIWLDVLWDLELKMKFIPKPVPSSSEVVISSLHRRSAFKPL